MKKTITLLVLIISCICLSGCTVKYDLDFNKDKITESINIEDSDIDNMERCREISTYYYPSIPNPNKPNDDLTQKLEGEKYYENNHDVSDSICSLNYKYDFNINNYRNAYAPNYSVKFFNFLRDNDFYTLSTGEKFYIFDEYPELDTIEVHISSNHKVRSNNADRVEGYNYYWTINRDNPKHIQITFYRNKFIGNYKGELQRKIMLIGAILLGVGIIVLIYYRKYKKTMKI